MNQAEKILIIGGTSEARIFGTFLKNEGIEFTFTLTTEPLGQYPFAYRITKLLDIKFIEDSFIVQFEDGEDVYDFIVDLTHPHASALSQIVEKTDTIKKSSERLWRFQRTGCLNKSERVDSCEAMSRLIIETKSKVILSFMGCKGTQSIARELDHMHHSCVIHLRSIKRPDFVSDYVTLIPISFSPSDMNSEELLKTLISTINPEIVVLKDSGKFGGTDVKKKILEETGTRFAGLAMPKKKGGRVFTELECLKEKVKESLA